MASLPLKANAPFVTDGECFPMQPIMAGPCLERTISGARQAYHQNYD
jgi:hypothetical protein